MVISELVAHLNAIHRRYGDIPCWVYGLGGFSKCYSCESNDVTVGTAGATFKKLPKGLNVDQTVVLIGSVEP
jgi:hypothetical protein